MKFLDIAKSVRMICGMQGTGPAAVTGLQGVEEVIVKYVQDAYVDIQNLREDWKWLEGSKSFSTTAGKSTYSIFDIFTLTTSPLKKYQLDSFRVTDTQSRIAYLRFKDRDQLEYEYLNDTTQRIPSVFTIDPPTNSVILKPIPADTYTITFRYQKVPEFLTTNDQVPLLPDTFHNLIVYKAAEKMAIYLSSPEIYRGYSSEVARMTGQLMRLELPKMRFRAGALV